MILKSTSKPRKRKTELIAQKRVQEEEKEHIQYLKSVEKEFHTKDLKFDDALGVLEENERMLQYMKERGILDSNGNPINN